MADVWVQWSSGMSRDHLPWIICCDDPSIDRVWVSCRTARLKAIAHEKNVNSLRFEENLRQATDCIVENLSSHFETWATLRIPIGIKFLNILSFKSYLLSFFVRRDPKGHEKVCAMAITWNTRQSVCSTSRNDRDSTLPSRSCRCVVAAVTWPRGFRALWNILIDILAKGNRRFLHSGLFCKIIFWIVCSVQK